MMTLIWVLCFKSAVAQLTLTVKFPTALMATGMAKSVTAFPVLSSQRIMMKVKGSEFLFLKKSQNNLTPIKYV